MTGSYYKGAHGIFLVYDITDRDSFLSLGLWLAEIEKHSNPNVVKILVANKTDLDFKRIITKEEGQNLASKNNMKYIETSARQTFCVQEAFKLMVREIKNNLTKEIPVPNSPSKSPKKGIFLN